MRHRCEQKIVFATYSGALDAAKSSLCFEVAVHMQECDGVTPRCSSQLRLLCDSTHSITAEQYIGQGTEQSIVSRLLGLRKRMYHVGL